MSLPPSWQRGWRRLFPLLLFASALLTRTANLQSRPVTWVSRAFNFWVAWLRGDSGGTAFTGHPGVTVMWLAGAGQFAYMLVLGRPLSLLEQATASMLPLIITISLAIVALYFVLRRLLGEAMATVAALLIAFDPHQSATASIVHPDALLSILIALALAILLVSVAEDRPRWTILAGVTAGLALLTKLPALVLAPMAVLATATPAAGMLWSAYRARQPWPWFEAFKRMFSPLLLWVLAASLTVRALWPAMWIDPLKAWDLVYRIGFARHALVDSPIRRPFFLGHIWAVDPGWPFYLLNASVMLTTVASVFALAAVILLLFVGWRASEDRRPFMAGLALLICAGGFYVGITGAGDKIHRYGLPLLTLFAVLAAIGIVWWARALARYLAPSTERRALLQAGLIAALLAAHAAAGLSHWPYLANAGNDALGGTRAFDYVIGLGLNGEGIKEAIAFVQHQPGGAASKVVCSVGKLCAQYATFKSFDESAGDQGNNYTWAIYTRNNILRSAIGLPGGQTPLFTVRHDGLPFAWVYGGAAVAAANPSQPATDIQFPAASDFGPSLQGLAALALAAVGVALAWRQRGHAPAGPSPMPHTRD